MASNGVYFAFAVHIDGQPAKRSTLSLYGFGRQPVLAVNERKAQRSSHRRCRMFRPRRLDRQPQNSVYFVSEPRVTLLISLKVFARKALCEMSRLDTKVSGVTR